jgi:PEGA domain
MKTETFEDRKTRGIKFIFIGVVLVSICIFGFIFLLTVTFVSPNQIQTPQETPTKTSNLGSIEVMSFPYGASIYLDNEYIGETPTNITNIEPGYHLITLILS